MNIILIGMMGCGKSTIGKLVAKKLNWKFYDSDKLIERQVQMNIAALFKKKGEKSFRALEKKMIHNLSLKDHAVIATGGGAPCFKENRDSFSKNGFVIYLKANPTSLYERLQKISSRNRPLLKGDRFTIETISKILTKRKAYYQKADMALENDALSPEQTAEKIVSAIELKIRGAMG